MVVEQALSLLETPWQTLEGNHTIKDERLLMMVEQEIYHRS